jgi:protein AFG1
MTSAVPLQNLFMSESEVSEAMGAGQKSGELTGAAKNANPDEHADVSDAMRSMMDDLGMNMSMLKNSNLFTGDEERFAFARALSRLSEMGSKEWVERGLGMEAQGGKEEMEGWKKVRSRWREDSA